MSHRHNHKVPASHGTMRWIRVAPGDVLQLEPMTHYLAMLNTGPDQQPHYVPWLGEELALYMRRFQLAVPYIAEIIDPRRLDYAHRPQPE